jgi:hypothetical protein
MALGWLAFGAKAPTIPLTTHRVRQETADLITSITLDAVASCRVLQESVGYTSGVKDGARGLRSK